MKFLAVVLFIIVTIYITYLEARPMWIKGELCADKRDISNFSDNSIFLKNEDDKNYSVFEKSDGHSGEGEE